MSSGQSAGVGNGEVGARSGSRGQHNNAWFTAEIQHMMHGFGDCRNPLLESALIIEDIVCQQMTCVLEQVEEIGRLRNAKSIGIEEFLFLLRKDKMKLRRLIRYVELRDMKTAIAKGTNLDEDDMDLDVKPQSKKRKRLCYDFISMIDQTGELMDVFNEEVADSTKHERLMRAELQTRTMDAQSYRKFCESRQASFGQKLQKFRDWIISGMSLELKPNTLAMEVLAYLAYETVAQVVDLSLLVSRDMRTSAHDPFVAAMMPACVNHHMLQMSGVFGMQQTPGSIGGAATMVGQPSPAASPNDLAVNREHAMSEAIQPEVIREVMRRYSRPTGPFAQFSKMPLPQTALFCS